MGIPAGTQVGPYQVLSQLGAGGMGEVYRAYDPRLSRDVALKVIRRILSVGPDGEDDTLDRLLREAILASALNHPNIVTIYETGVFDTDRYIAMELVEGSTLRQVARQGLAVGRALGIARQVSEALAVAHAAQIVHRDIKPDNVMVRPDGYVKLLDFGLARVQPEMATIGQPAATTEAGLLLGTVAYMAPEQARGEMVTQEADVFSLGVMLYELVTGRHPFAAPSQLGTLHALMWESPEPPSFANPELPRAIDQLIVEMLQKDPRLRPGASEVMYRLNLAHDSTIAVALSAVTVTQPPRGVAREIVGRDQELEGLRHEYERAQRGQGRLVVISAEAGMGKTTLVDTFIKQLDEQQEPVRVGRGRCSERLAGSEAYLPILEALDSLQKNEQLGSIARLIRAVAPSWYTQIMPASDNESSAARLAAETAAGSQERLKRELAALFEELGRMQPVVLCLDDMHWADPPTTDLLAYLARRIDTTRLLIITTCRPSDLAQGRHQFLSVKLDLIARGMCREITPESLDLVAVARYIALQFPEHGFPSDFARLVHERSEGNPLFMSDLLRDLRRRQQVRQTGRPLGARRRPALGRARAARVDPQRRAAQGRGIGRRRSAAAGRGERPGCGLRYGAHRRGASAPRRRGRGSARPAAARACAGAVHRRARGPRPHADAPLPLRTPPLLLGILRIAARHTPRRPEPGDRRAAGAADRRRRLRVRGAARGAVRNGARLRACRALLESRRAGRRAAARARRNRTARTPRTGSPRPGARQPGAPRDRARSPAHLRARVEDRTRVRRPRGRRGLRARTRALPAGQGPRRASSPS